MPRPEPLPLRPSLLHRRVLGWYESNRRELQWRTTRDPYAILVSEVMLQQTQVGRVKAKLPLFLRQFPSIGSLARASVADVVRAWSGMGYNNRALRLRELARIVVEGHRGRLPRDAAPLMELPGVGRYTAHALLCFAFGKNVPVVDVNIRRVLSRVFWKMRDLRAAAPEPAAWELAAQVLPEDGYTWNQALMDLGATVCTARRPRCGNCPLRSHCSSGDVLASAAPAPPRRRASPEPSYRGVPQRIWRGRTVQALRTVPEPASIVLHELGRMVKPDFHAGESKWLLSIVDGLAKDGIVTKRRSARAIRIRLAS